VRGPAIWTGRPGPGRPAGADSVDTRRRVVEAACHCFARYGYGPATNTVIAERAGVTAGSVYYHFGSKHNLFAAVCAHVYGRIADRLRRAVDGAHSVPDLLRAALVESDRIHRETPELTGFVASAPVDARRYPELAAAFAEQSGRLAAALAEAVAAGQAAGRIPADADPGALAGLIGAVVDGFAHVATTSDPVLVERLTELIERFVLPG